MPTPRKSPASANKKKGRRSSLLAAASSTASPLASTSKATLDSPARSVKGSAKKGKATAKRAMEEVEQEQDEQEDEDEEEQVEEEEGEGETDDRFTAFLADAGEDEGADGAEEDDFNLDEDEAPSPFAADDRFSSFPTEDDHLDSAPLTEKELLARTTLPAHLLPRSATSKKAKIPGLVYLSRIPPGMGPGKVKHLLGKFGEVGRIYLARADAGKEVSAAKRAKQRERHQSHNFKEGWVEFMDKRVARSVAEMLNAQTIGGKKSERWHDDIWTMKYLPRFRWDQLSEQVALERATQTSLLRFHLTHSKSEQESYLSAVERARTNNKIEEKAASRGKKRERAADGEEGKDGKAGKKREFRQREVVDLSKKLKRDSGAGGGEKQLESVLGRLF